MLPAFFLLSRSADCQPARGNLLRSAWESRLEPAGWDHKGRAENVITWD